MVGAGRYLSDACLRRDRMAEAVRLCLYLGNRQRGRLSGCRERWQGTDEGQTGRETTQEGTRRYGCRAWKSGAGDSFGRAATGGAGTGPAAVVLPTIS